MPSAKNPQESAAVLVVDEDGSAREHLRSIFEAAGYRALSAEDTTAALRLLQKTPCDLIVIDVALPDVDGLALCRLLRAQLATSKLPIIIISNDETESRKLEAFAAGADDYIVKSSPDAEILSRSTAHLRAAQREWALLGSNRELTFLADLGLTVANARSRSVSAARRRLNLRRNQRHGVCRLPKRHRYNRGGLCFRSRGKRRGCLIAESQSVEELAERLYLLDPCALTN